MRIRDITERSSISCSLCNHAFLDTPQEYVSNFDSNSIPFNSCTHISISKWENFETQNTAKHFTQTYLDSGYDSFCFHDGCVIVIFCVSWNLVHVDLFYLVFQSLRVLYPFYPFRPPLSPFPFFLFLVLFVDLALPFLSANVLLSPSHLHVTFSKIWCTTVIET